MQKKIIPISVSVIILLLIITCIYQRYQIKSLKKAVHIGAILLYPSQRAKEINDSLYISQYLIGKNIEGWGIVNHGELIKLYKAINPMASAPTQSPFFPIFYSASTWDVNYDFDPDNNNLTFDTAYFKYRLQNPYSQSKDVVGKLYCNHTYDPNNRTWQININIDKERVKPFSNTENFELRK